MIAVTEKASAHIQKLMAKQGLAEGGFAWASRAAGARG